MAIFILESDLLIIKKKVQDIMGALPDNKDQLVKMVENIKNIENVQFQEGQERYALLESLLQEPRKDLPALSKVITFREAQKCAIMCLTQLITKRAKELNISLEVSGLDKEILGRLSSEEHKQLPLPKADWQSILIASLEEQTSPSFSLTNAVSSSSETSTSKGIN